MMVSLRKMIVQTTLLALTLSYGAAGSITKCDKRQQLPVTKIINSLGYKLEQILDSKANYFFSPLSISVALAMVYIGARGTTREQMAEALEYNIIGKNCLPNKISESFQELIHSLHSEEDDFSFLIANGAFLQRGFQISHYYSSSLQRFFNSNVKFLDFAEEQTATMEQINDWVVNYTKGKISKLLNEPLDPLTVMVLINAVYFKGLWTLPFNEENTSERLFFRINNTAKAVPFMSSRYDAYNYYDEEKKYFFLELEYSGNISMILILPENIKEYPQFEMTSDTLCDLRKKFRDTSVNVIIPKFSMDFKRELSKDMAKLGMEDLFSDRADLTGIRERNDLHVSLMVHKAIIEVNEKGTVASSILGIGIDGKSKAPEVFLADHPFLFYIIHKETNTVLFSGRVVDP